MDSKPLTLKPSEQWIPNPADFDSKASRAMDSYYKELFIWLAALVASQLRENFRGIHENT